MRTIFGHGCLCRPGAIALVLTLTTAQAYAQEPQASAAPTSEARAHFDRGVTFYEETDYSAALVEFKRAYTLAPTWQVLFNIGQSYFQLRNYALALVTLRQFIEQGGNRIPPERRALVDTESMDLANRVGHTRILSNRTGATISVDEEVVGVTPVKDPVLVSVGIRKLKAVYPGTPAVEGPVEVEVSVPAGETVDVRLDFPDSPPPMAAEPSARPREVPTAAASEQATVATHSRAPALVSFGVAVAATAIGAVFGGLTLRDKSRLEGECVGKACVVGSRPDIDAVSRDGAIATVGFSVAAVGLATGVVFWLAAGGSAARDGGITTSPPAPRTSFGPGFVAGTF
jgi:hypothetical protein